VFTEQQRWRKERLVIPTEFTVDAPTVATQRNPSKARSLRINKVEASSYLEEIKEKFSDIPDEKSIWLDQLFRLVQVAQVKPRRDTKNSTTPTELRHRKQYRTAAGHVLWALSREEFCDLEAMAEEVTLLTVEVCQKMIPVGGPTILEDQKEALQTLFTLDEATGALSVSASVSIAGVGGIRTFVPSGETSTLDAEGSQV
jgi:hypothetical protein